MEDFPTETSDDISSCVSMNNADGQSDHFPPTVLNYAGLLGIFQCLEKMHSHLITFAVPPCLQLEGNVPKELACNSCIELTVAIISEYSGSSMNDRRDYRTVRKVPLCILANFP